MTGMNRPDNNGNGDDPRSDLLSDVLKSTPGMAKINKTYDAVIGMQKDITYIKTQGDKSAAKIEEISKQMAEHEVRITHLEDHPGGCDGDSEQDSKEKKDLLNLVKSMQDRESKDQETRDKRENEDRKDERNKNYLIIVLIVGLIGTITAFIVKFAGVVIS